MASHAPQPFPRRLETGPDGPVEHLVAYPCQDAADHRRVDHHVDLHLLAGGPRERLSQLLAPLQGERDGRTHLRDHVLSPLRGKVGQALHDRAELPGPALPDQEPQDAHGVGVRPVAEQLVLHRPQVVLRIDHRQEGLGVALHDLVLGGHYAFPFPDPETCSMNWSTSFCWVVLSSSFSTTRSASSTAIWPTSDESSRSTRSRSALISWVARATVAPASCSALA